MDPFCSHLSEYVPVQEHLFIDYLYPLYTVKCHMEGGMGSFHAGQHISNINKCSFPHASHKAFAPVAFGGPSACTPYARNGK